MNRDAFNNANPHRVSLAAMSVIDAAQRGFVAHEQAHGIACAFLLLAEHLRIPAQDLFTATKNLMNDTTGKRPEFRAITDYLRNEVKL